MLQVNVTRLHDDNRESLQLAWIAGQDGSTAVRREAAASAALIGHLNLTHPNSIQVLGSYEDSMFDGFTESARADFVSKLFAGALTAVIVADDVTAPEEILAGAKRTHTPLFATPLAAPRVIEALTRYLAKALAEKTTRHGVFMDVLGLGVLVTGESGVGKSELGLELIRHSFDNEISTADGVFDGTGVFDAGQGGFGKIGVDLASLDPGLQQSANFSLSAAQGAGKDIFQHGPVAAQGGRVGDAAAHWAGSDDGDYANGYGLRHSLLGAVQSL